MEQVRGLAEDAVERGFLALRGSLTPLAEWLLFKPRARRPGNERKGCEP